jgi:hypothetical protein
VNGSFSENGLQCQYAMAPNPDKVQPGSLVGQPFSVDNYSWEPTRGAGITTWDGTPFGAILDRLPIPGTQGSGDRNLWIGSWAMDHDGWQGTLTVTGFVDIPLPWFRLTVVQASYQAADGTVSSVSGTLDTFNELHLSLTIAFPGNNQPFQLYRFSWETDNAAGTTTWSGTTYGVRLHKDT